MARAVLGVGGVEEEKGPTEFAGRRIHEEQQEIYMNVEASSGPGILIPPPVIYLSGLALGFLLDQIWPVPALPDSLRYISGSVVIVVSGLVMPFVFMRFRRAGTTLNVHKPATALITEGPYRFSRNPIYVSLTLLYLGVGILLDQGWSLILVAPVFLVMNIWVVSREERHLEASFGDEYLRYKAAVRRWI